MRLDYLKKTAKKQTGITNEEFDAEVKEYKFPNAKAEVDDETVEIILERCALTVEERNRVANAHPAPINESAEIKTQFEAFQAMVAQNFVQNNETVKKTFILVSNEIKALRDRVTLIEGRLEGMKTLIDNQDSSLEEFKAEINLLLTEAKIKKPYIHPDFIGLEEMFEPMT